MWQFVFVAAVAGSGILVKHLFRNGYDDDERVRVSSSSSSVSEQKEEEEEDQSKTTVEEEEEENVMEEVQRKQEEESVVDIVKPEEEEEEALISIVSSSSCIGDSWMSEKLMLHPVVVEDEGSSSSSSIFRFTNSRLNGGGGEEEGSKSRSGNVNNVKRRTSSTSTSSSSSRGEKSKLMLEEEEEDQKKKKKKKKNKERRRNVCFCLKRRRTTTAKIAAFRSSSGSCNQSKGNSLFSCGVGFGFMLSAGKAEFNKLTAHIEEETTQLISNLQDSSSCKDRAAANMETMGMDKEPLLMTDFSVKLANPNDPQVLDLSSNGDGECPSSILTEEVDLEALEMDRLEAELESELQKIPNEADPDYFMDFPDTELSAYALEGPQESHDMDPNSSQFNGVSPTDLDRKLCHVLIKQQESQIAELESNLYLSQMKLREKDAELRKLKAVVCSLRDFSLETASDDEAENGVILDEVEEEKEMKSNADSLIHPRTNDDGSNKIIVVKEQKSLCGVKRLMEFESYANCQVNHNTLVS